jgi:mannose-6-phosphate isomerase-like protein (cupin superfamily)
VIDSQEGMTKLNEYYFEEGCYILELSNTPDDPACSVARARVEPGQTTRWHRLHGITERYVILEGEGLAELERTESRKLGPGDVIVIQPGQEQRITNLAAVDLVFLVVCTPRFVPGAYEDTETLLA